MSRKNKIDMTYDYDDYDYYDDYDDYDNHEDYGNYDDENTEEAPTTAASNHCFPSAPSAPTIDFGIFSAIYSLPSLFLIGTELTHPDVASQAALGGVRHLASDSYFFPLKNPPEPLCKSLRKYALEAASFHDPPATTFKLVASTFHGGLGQNGNEPLSPMSQFSFERVAHSSSNKFSVFSCSSDFKSCSVARFSACQSVPSSKDTVSFFNLDHKETSAMFFSHQKNLLFTSKQTRLTCESISSEGKRSPSFVTDIPHAMNHVSSPSPSTVVCGNFNTSVKNSVVLFSMMGDSQPLYTIPADKSMSIQTIKSKGNLLVVGGCNMVKIYDTRTKPVARAEMKFNWSALFTSSSPSMEIACGRVFFLNMAHGLFYSRKIMSMNSSPPNPTDANVIQQLQGKAVKIPTVPSAMCFASGHILHASSSFNIFSLDIRKSNTPFSQTCLRKVPHGGGGEGIVKMVGDDTKLACVTKRHSKALNERRQVAAERSLASARGTDHGSDRDDEEDEVGRRQAAVHARQQAKKLAQVERERGKKAKEKERKQRRSRR
ncbi:hypothetical protein TrRE_jg8814 [Triparma retinervis]|uniref:Uncharacterized protein n=1 Tax=Triparma retinervis TaxID=2557542 RepID=A0A9W7FIF2_9STRA|nr:hypothetical protein TrRE_jg8814 [Triparma retinervis]